MTTKKVYHITEKQKAFQVWYYEVEAESEEEALKIVENGDVDSVDYEVHADHFNPGYEARVTQVTDLADDDEEDIIRTF